jgi:hypothetical protein
VNLQLSASPRWTHAVHGSLRSHLLLSVFCRTGKGGGCENLNLRRRHSLQETGMRFRFLTWRLLAEVALDVFVSSESRRSEEGVIWGGSSRSWLLLDIVQQFSQTGRGEYVM